MWQTKHICGCYQTVMWPSTILDFTSEKQAYINLLYERFRISSSKLSRVCDICNEWLTKYILGYSFEFIIQYKPRRIKYRTLQSIIFLNYKFIVNIITRNKYFLKILKKRVNIKTVQFTDEYVNIHQNDSLPKIDDW